MRKINEKNQDIYSDESDKEYDNLRLMVVKYFQNSAIDYRVMNDGPNISITFWMRKKELFSTIVELFDNVNRLRKDIFPQYDSEYELYRSKRTGGAVFQFDFALDADEPSSDDLAEEDEVFNRNAGMNFNSGSSAKTIKGSSDFEEEEDDDDFETRFNKYGF